MAQQASDFTLMSNQHQNPEGNSTQRRHQSDMNAVGVKNDSRPPMDSKMQNGTLSHTSIISNSLEHAAEIQHLKNAIYQLEQVALLDQEEKEDLEQAMRIVLQVQSLGNQYKLLFQELSLKIRDTNKARRDRLEQSSKLLAIEQKYHSKSKASINGAINSEVTGLKQQIIKERTYLLELESMVGQQQAEQQRIIEDILRSNTYAVD